MHLPSCLDHPRCNAYNVILSNCHVTLECTELEFLLRSTSVWLLMYDLLKPVKPHLFENVLNRLSLKLRPVKYTEIEDWVLMVTVCCGYCFLNFAHPVHFLSFCPHFSLWNMYTYFGFVVFEWDRRILLIYLRVSALSCWIMSTWVIIHRGVNTWNYAAP